MKTRTKAQEARLLLDSLEKAAAESVDVVKGLPGVKGKQGDLLPKTPDGLRSLISVLQKSYAAVRDQQNAPTVEEMKILTKLEPAKKALREAEEVYEKARDAFRQAAEGHTHRIQLTDPAIHPQTGVATYFPHPKCLLCGELLLSEWYCIQSPDLHCAYPNVLSKGGADFIRGSDLKAAGHDGDIECIHCNQTWVRVD